MAATQAQVGEWGLLVKAIWMRSFQLSAGWRCFQGRQACDPAALWLDSSNFCEGNHTRRGVLPEAFSVHLHGAFDSHAPGPTQ